jgi:peptide/nickel transport system substrate-binding protein
VVLFLYRESEYNDEVAIDRADDALVDVAKHRNGPTGKANLLFLKQYARFENFDTTPATAVKVYNYLNAESTDLSTYTTNPLWKVVDGPWKMSAYTPSNGAVSFVPNPDYSGPEKPHLSQFNEQVFTTTDAEFNDLISGSGPQVGYISPVEVKSQSALDRVGYSQDQSYSFSVAYTQINFNNPKVGPLFKQTYIRQALQMLVDQAGLTKHYFGGFGYNTCGPVPTEPANSFADSYVAKCPFNYNPTRAVSTLKAHGWKVVPGGISTCAHPGTGSGECGAGITSGEPLKFTYLYGSGGIAFPKSMAQQKSDAEAAGVDYVLDGEPGSQVEEAAVPCTPKQPACSWQMAYAGWIYSPDYYPTGETLFATGAGYNVGSYSDPQTDKLINATTEPGNPQQTLDAYQNYIADQLPVLWQGGTTSLNEVSNKLHGVTPFNVFGNILPEEWYYTK